MSPEEAFVYVEGRPKHTLEDGALGHVWKRQWWGDGAGINYWVDRKWPLEFQEERVSIFT